MKLVPAVPPHGRSLCELIKLLSCGTHEQKNGHKTGSTFSLALRLILEMDFLI
jgi:hypothetical protein